MIMIEEARMGERDPIHHSSPSKIERWKDKGMRECDCR